jgi:hypothetical protein
MPFEYSTVTIPEELAEQEAIKGETIGWQPLGEGGYLHHGDPSKDENVVTVVGIADAGMAGMNVVLLG